MKLYRILRIKIAKAEDMTDALQDALRRAAYNDGKRYEIVSTNISGGEMFITACVESLNR